MITFEQHIRETNQIRLEFMLRCSKTITIDELTDEKWRKFRTHYCEVKHRKDKINKIKERI